VAIHREAWAVGLLDSERLEIDPLSSLPRQVVAAALDLLCEDARVPRERDGMASKAMPGELVQRYAESPAGSANGVGTAGGIGWMRGTAKSRTWRPGLARRSPKPVWSGYCTAPATCIERLRRSMRA
jgi:hypothetical protein